MFTILTTIQSQAQTGGYNGQQLPFLQRTPTGHLLWSWALGHHVHKNHKQALSPKTNIVIWREQRLFSWLIGMATICKTKYIFCTTRNLRRPKDWHCPRITKSFQGYTSTSPMSSLLHGLQQGGELYFWFLKRLSQKRRGFAQRATINCS